jgi:hypothetical protein
MSIQVTIEISSRRIADMFDGAIEGNYMTRSWCESITVSEDQYETYLTEAGGPWYDNPDFFSQSGYEIIVEHDGKNSDEGARDSTTIITPKMMQQGLQIMATKYSKHFVDMIEERDDNITQDVFLQCIVLKDVVFG